MRGSTLKKILSEQGISISELARRLNVPSQTLYSMVKRDNQKVDFDLMMHICAELDVPVERIPEYEAGLYERMAAQYSDVLDAIRINGDLTASQEERLKTAISSYTADFLGERAQEA